MKIKKKKIEKKKLKKIWPTPPPPQKKKIGKILSGDQNRLPIFGLAEYPLRLLFFFNDRLKILLLISGAN